MTKGAFYFYFQSKEALAWAVLERKQEEWLGRVSGQVLGSGDPVSQLRGLADAMLDLHRADPSAWSISKLTKELAQFPGVGAEVRRPMSQWVEFVAGLIRAAQAAGRACGDVDATDLAVVLVGGFDGLKGLFDVLDGDAAEARFEAGVRMLARMAEATLAL
jgi:AcrR family transcriptional regulator